MHLGLEKGDRVGLWAPNCAEWTLVQYATAEIGVILVNINPAYRTHELAYALNQSGCRWLDRRARVQDVELRRRWSTRSAAEVPTLERAVFFWDRRVGRAVRRRRSSAMRRPGRAPRLAATRRRDQHPVHVGHDRLPEGRHAHPSQHPQQRLLRHRAAGHRPTSDRLCIPVPFYHCFGMVMGNLGCTSHGATMVIPGDAFDPKAVLEAVQDETLYRALRRADDVHRRARSSRLRVVRPVVTAHGRDGRIAMSGRGDEAVRRPDAHGRRHHLLRHDRDLARVDPDLAGRLPAPSHRHGRRGPPARRDPDRRPGHAARRSIAARPASSARAGTR